MQQKKIVDTRTVYLGKKMKMVEIDLLFGDGHKETWEYAENLSDGVVVAALTNNNELIFVNEYRGAAGKYVLRLPTGAIEDGETPEQASQRELVEETGFWAENTKLVEEQGTTSSYYKSKLYFTVAENLQQRATNREKGEHDMEVLLVPLAKAFSMVDNLEIQNPQAIYTILRFKKYLRDIKSPLLK